MMGLREQLNQDLQAAMRAGDERRKLTIRSIMASISRVETAGAAATHLDDEAILQVVAREAKQRRDAIAEYERGGREDLVAQERAELEILEAYLPRQLSPAEIEALAREVIAEVGATQPGQMGEVMRHLMPKVQGRADGRQVSQIVRNLLAS